MPQVFGQLEEWHPVSAAGKSGVIDQEIYAAEFLEGRLDRSFHVLTFHDVSHSRQTAPPLPTDLFRRAFDIPPASGLLIRWVLRRVATGTSDDDVCAELC